MSLFDIPDLTRNGKPQDIKIAQRTKVKSKSVSTVKGGNTLLDKLNQARKMIQSNLSQYKDDCIIITDKDILHDYIRECRQNEYISIDTETTGLNPITDKIVGICINTREQKGAYIPINHISYMTNERLTSQLDAQFVADEFKNLLLHKPYIDMFNSQFDIRFLRHFDIVDAYCTWDGYLAARLMNENEQSTGLKQLHKKYCMQDSADVFTFSDLFPNSLFSLIPYELGGIYGAHDAVITKELCDFQRSYLNPNSSRQDMRDLYFVMTNIEMPCVKAVVEMEDTGIEIDLKTVDELSKKYNGLLDDALNAVHMEISKYDNLIEEYKSSHVNHKLDTPINVSSPTQLAILLYDILKMKIVDKKKPRGTGEEILSKITDSNIKPIADTILKYREIAKLVDTYIDKLPKCLLEDNRIHGEFNQYGADTGRFSSSNPNLQNIPSHNKDIRKMFKASDGFVLMSADYSSQEPKCLAALCKQQGDSQMYDTFMQGKDLYSEIASKAFNKPYEECLEFNSDGTTNKQGKERRTQAKSILLGTLYGRGEASIAEQLKCSVEKAKQIKDSVFKGFPAIKTFEQDSLKMAKELGYVTTVCGRKRRLPDLQLDEFEFHWKDNNPYDDVLDFDNIMSDYVPDRVANKYLKQLYNSRYYADKQKVIDKADKDGITIRNNGKKIADATRQCVNSRIQGSAADLTKLAMIKLVNNDELRQLGFRLLIQVHDEVISECPQVNAKRCSELIAEIMSKAAEEILEMPIKTDVEITKVWYGERIAV